MENSAIIREIQDRRTQVYRRLAQLQQQIYKLEDQYLEASQTRGNVVRGWEGFLDFKQRGGGSSGSSSKKEKKLRASERIFSFSSMSAPIPKSELDKDEEAEVALKWAQEYKQAFEHAKPESTKEGSTVAGSSAKRQRKE